ncbi:hypothetical protein [uncultured Pantoea sp.]|uniref:hypothetical protein n=1 Tax=uncultured Pantoea sp. TaxID=218084 RepID=UPI0025DE7616|nr:hypothetical protein [uncultured Pantoea sp.]
MLLDMPGMYEWALLMATPFRIITEYGLLKTDELSKDNTVIGVVTYENMHCSDVNKSPI